MRIKSENWEQEQSSMIEQGFVLITDKTGTYWDNAINEK